MRLPFGEQVTVQRLGQDPFGDTVVVSEHPVSQCAVLLRSSTEPLDLRSDVVTTATLLAPHGSDITEHDRVVQADGTKWEVVGKPANITSPLTGWRPGLRATLQHVSG